MAIDTSKLVSPFSPKSEIVSVNGEDKDLVSPFDISAASKMVKSSSPSIGPLEELEGALGLITSMAASVPAGIEGLARQLATDMGFSLDVSATQAIEDVTQGLTFEPRTEGGKKALETFSTPFKLMDEAAQWVGDKIFDITESPGIAANVKALTMFMIPKAAIGAAKTTGKIVKSSAGATIESVNMLRPKVRKAMSSKAVGLSLRENIGDSIEVTKNISESGAISKAIPDINLTLAETTLKPSMIVRERNLAEADQSTFDLAKSRRQQNMQAIDDFRMENFGDSAPEITSILNRSQGNINKAIAALDERISKVSEKREDLAQRSPSMELESVGSELRKLEQSEYVAAKAIGEILYNKVGNVKVDPAPVAAELRSLAETDLLDLSQDQIPSSFAYTKRLLTPEKPEGKIITEQKQAPEPKEISFDTLRSIEKRLKRDMAAERGKVGADPETTRLIGRVLDSVEQVKVGMEGTGDAGVVTALREANSFWKEGVVDRFYKGAGRDINSKTPFNEFRIVDEKVIDSFFSTATKTKGGVKGIDDFINTYGMNPEAWAQLRLGVYKKFRSASGIEANGVIDSTKAARFLNKHEAVLDRIPQIRNELSSINEANNNLANGAQILKKKQANIQSGILAKTLKTNAPDTVVKNAIKERGQEMLVIRAMAAKVKGGLDALSKETGRQLLNMSERTDGSINSAKLLNEMRKNKTSLEVGMGFEHYTNLEILHKAYLRIDKNSLPTSVRDPKLGIEKIAETFGTTPAQAISAWRAKSRGMVGGPHLVAQLGTSFITRINKRQIDAIERLAHYDPAVAKTLMMMTKQKGRSTTIETRMAKHLAEYGLTGTAAGTEEE